MSRTYKATGINLKSMPLGEADRLVTILTRECGLIRVVAPGARKQNSKLGGRTGLFVVNELLLAKGRSLDKITQAETLESYPGLSQDLGKLAASQYLAEIVLYQALSEQPQVELYELLSEHLRRIAVLPNTKSLQASGTGVFAHLSQGVFHLLALGGVAPQVQACCVTQHPLKPNFLDPDWRVGFSMDAGGTVTLSGNESGLRGLSPMAVREGRVAEATNSYQVIPAPIPPKINVKLNAVELALLQQLGEADLPQIEQVSGGQPSTQRGWVTIERLLRDYAQYQFGRSIRSATLVDAIALPE
ncbi:MAG: DNA repair protein RecO [Kastovskya adunca ATA6-11-RM4]|nr:DNA repair protein RecO [Kastovskya adunca ATA6-11-RM4]